MVVFVDDYRLSWQGDTIESYVDFHMDRLFGTPSEQSLLETAGNYIGIDIDASPNHLEMSNTKTRESMRALLNEYDLPVLEVSTPFRRMPRHWCTLRYPMTIPLFPLSTAGASSAAVPG